MSLKELEILVHPPSSPKDVGNTDDRERIESSLGLRLPDDYWSFANRYGSGRFMTDNFGFWVSNPFSHDFRDNIQWGFDLIAPIDLSIEPMPAEIPEKDQKPRLLLWGADENGNTLFWSTLRTSSDSWPVVLCPETGDPSEFELFEMPMTEFLVKAIRKQLTCNAWNAALAFADGCPPKFVPA